MSKRKNTWGIKLVSIGLSVGLASLSWTMSGADPAFAATTCGVSGGVATVELDQAAPAATTVVAMDGSGNLTVDGGICGAGFPSEIKLSVAGDAPAQTVVLDQTAAGGVFPCTTLIDGTLRMSDRIDVDGAASENLTVGDTPTGTGVNLNSCSSAGTVVSVGSYQLNAGSGSGTATISAGGGTGFTSGLTIPATLAAGSGSSDTFLGGLVEDTIDFSALTDPLTVNVSGTTVGPMANDTASGDGTYNFTSFGTTPVIFDAADAATTFYAGTAADSFDGTGTAQATVSWAAMIGGGSLRVCVGAPSGCTAGEAVLGSVVEPFSDIASFVGLAGGNTEFSTAGTGGHDFTGSGSGNVLDVSNAPADAEVDVPNGTVTGLDAGGKDSFSGINTFMGSTSGDTVFDAGSASETFIDPGSAAGDSIDFSAVATSGATPLLINVSGGPASTANDTAQVGSAIYTFTTGGTGFTGFTGSSDGNTTFDAGAGGGYSFAGAVSDTLNLAGAPSQVQVSLATGTVTGLSSAGEDTFSGIPTVIGSTSGGTTFVAGTGNETFSAGGNGNTIDFSALTSPLTVDVSGTQVGSTQNDTASTANATYRFTSFGTTPLILDAANAATTFYAGAVTDTFNGTGAAQATVSWADVTGNEPLLVCLATSSGCTAGQAELGAVIEPFSDIAGFVGLATGNTSFVASDTGGHAFTGNGTANTLDLTAADGAAVDLGDHEVTGLAGSGQDTFSDIQHFDVDLRFTSAAPAGADVGGSYTPTLAATGSTSPVVLSIDAATTNDACSISNDDAATVEFDHVGECVIDANQAGDDEFAATQPTTQHIAVGKLATSIHVTVVRQTITATVSPDGSAPNPSSGTITFSVDGTTVGTAPLDSEGVAALAYVVPHDKAHTVSAEYGGDSDLATATGSVARDNPTVTASVSSAHRRTSFGWYRSVVTVTFACRATSARLTAPCPTAVKLSHQGAGQAVKKTVTATDGGVTTAGVSSINIDMAAPTIHISGVRPGRTYTHPPHLTAHAVDRLSGVASTRIARTHHARHGVTTVDFRVVAVDKAGNTRVVTGSYKINAHAH